VAIGPEADYDDEHPSTALLIIEVAERSLAKDRGVKAEMYARNGATEYWVANAVDNIIEVHTDILNGSYTRVRPYTKGESIDLQSFAEVSLQVKRTARKTVVLRVRAHCRWRSCEH